jgi:hypothetical protein
MNCVKRRGPTHACFVWREYRSWTQKFQRRAPELFARDIRQHVIDADVCCQGPKPTWLEDAYLAVRDLYFDAESYALERFTEIYSWIRFYHATRSENPDFFRTNGIPLSDTEYLNKRAFELFDDDTGGRTMLDIHGCRRILQEKVLGEC